MQSGCALTTISSGWRPAALQESSDRDLLDSVATGDRVAMRALYARHNVRVYRFVLRLIGDESKAEDIVSDVFLAVWRQACRFQSRSQVSTWILAIARYKAISALRERQNETLEDDVAEAVVDQADNPQIALEKKDTSIFLRTCLKQLCREHREIIDLVYYHEKSVDEVAEIIGIPPSTVKTRMFYARRRIFNFLEQAGAKPRRWKYNAALLL